MKTPFIKRDALEKIVEEYPTPFHLYDEADFNDSRNCCKSEEGQGKYVFRPVLLLYYCDFMYKKDTLSEDNLNK